MKTFAREQAAYWRGRLKALGLQLESAGWSERRACPRGHLDAEYGVTNAEGYRRCRKCLAQNQARHVAKKATKARVVSRRRRHKRRAAAPTTAAAVAVMRPPAVPTGPVSPPLQLSAEQRLDLLKVAASAPRPPKRKPAANPATPPPHFPNSRRPARTSGGSTWRLQRAKREAAGAHTARGSRARATRHRVLHRLPAPRAALPVPHRGPLPEVPPVRRAL